MSLAPFCSQAQPASWHMSSCGPWSRNEGPDPPVGCDGSGSTGVASGGFRRVCQMWSTDTYWFDVAVVTAIFAVGSALFGRFEEHKPKWMRLLKVVSVVGLVVGLSAVGARWLAYSIIGLMLSAAAVVHVYWLPKHGVNGWTGEPKDRYYDLLGVPEEKRPNRRS